MFCATIKSVLGGRLWYVVLGKTCVRIRVFTRLQNAEPRSVKSLQILIIDWIQCLRRVAKRNCFRLRLCELNFRHSSHCVVVHRRFVFIFMALCSLSWLSYNRAKPVIAQIAINAHRDSLNMCGAEELNYFAYQPPT